MAPLPKPPEQRRRRNAAPQTIGLPIEGRSGPPPAWPFDSDEPDLWVEMWRTPQAVEWERLGWPRMVARYVVKLLEAEAPGSPVSLLGEVRAMEDRLGLSPMALLRLRWTISDEPVKAESKDNVVTPDRWRRESA